MATKILFVDDEEWSVNSYIDVLEDHHLTADLAKNGDEAIRKLKRQSYELIVLDIMVPPGEEIGKNVEPRRAGVNLLAMIRDGKIRGMKSSSAVPIIILTAVTDKKLLEEVRSKQVSEIFQKPAAFDQVTGKLLSLLQAGNREVKSQNRE